MSANHIQRYLLSQSLDYYVPTPNRRGH